METRTFENSPRAGTSSTGESRTPGSPGVCRTYTGAAQNALEGKGAVTTAKEGEGATMRDCPKPAHLTAPAADVLTDEDVDFSVYQPNASERIVRLAQRKKERGCPIRDLPNLPPVLRWRDVYETKPSTPPPTGRDEEVGMGLMRSPRVVLRDVMREFSLPPPQGRDYSTGRDSEDWPADSDDTASDISMDSEGLPTIPPERTRLKRRNSDSEDMGPPISKEAVPKAKKGRGRPPTTGQYVGLAKAQADLNKEKEEERRAAFRAKVEEVARAAREAREAREARASLRASPAPAEDTEQTSAGLAADVERALEMVTMVATRSSNLKGTYQRALKEAVASIKVAVTEMRGRGKNEEIRALEAQNDRLLRQVNAMRRELEELRRRVTGPAADDLQKMLSEVSRSNIETFGNMLNARIAGLEDRLLPEPRRRPPLAADGVGTSASAPITVAKKKTPKPKKVVTAKEPDRNSAEGAVAPLQPPAAPKEKETERPKKKKRKKRPTMAAQEATKGGQNINAPPAEAPWTTIGPQRQKKKGAATPAKAAPRKKKKKAKLRVPATAAITLTLGANAAEKGVTYSDVLLKAKNAVKASGLAELDIQKLQLRFRLAQTGARVLTIPGEGAQEKADSLAEKLREVLDPDVVKVGRPAKCVEMRIAGLDDSATTAEVLEAVSREGGCPANSIRSGPIRKGRWGDGSLWLSVPVAAAKKLLSLGRLRVGWVSAKVTLLAARPKRCYRCLDTGHLATTCQCPVDRSRNCFRCGKPEHKAAECREKQPNCFFCEALGKDKDHVLGSSGCVTAKPLPSTKRRKRRRAPSDKARPKEPGAGGAGVSQPQPAMEVEP
ncbi:uncharacterized protein LOC121739462 [Aricia agestis]|uniref:uncharacterized protein LOC121739462 n=1 Tax=Aricia agestis TaxID=91739 RepID=UPI001C2030B4|nr:uncharacterized protein LOC121739462 [Aricia agestis]